MPCLVPYCKGPSCLHHLQILKPQQAQVAHDRCLTCVFLVPWNPEGQKLLTEWIGHLRQTRVKFTHVAHHDLMHILQELPRLAAEQELKCEEMGARLMDLQDSQQ
ncbi:hypothetical protein WJX77_006554 [Trebouxia sp. C0004]